MAGTAVAVGVGGMGVAVVVGTAVAVAGAVLVEGTAVGSGKKVAVGWGVEAGKRWQASRSKIERQRRRRFFMAFTRGQRECRDRDKNRGNEIG